MFSVQDHGRSCKNQVPVMSLSLSICSNCSKIVFLSSNNLKKPFFEILERELFILL